MRLLKGLKGLLVPVTAAPKPAAPAAGDTGEAARRAGNAALQAGRPDDALAHYERYVAACPDSSSAHLNLGYALLQLQRPVEAAAALRQACRLDPGSHEAPFFLARALAAQDLLQDAGHALEEAVALRPGFEDGWIELGQLRERLALHGPARQAYERAAEIAGARIDAWQGLARVALLQHDGAAALAAVDRWLALSPQETVALCMRAEALGQLGRTTEALAAAEAALAQAPEDSTAVGRLAALLLNAGDFARAERQFRRFLELAPHRADGLSGLGAALHGLERHAEAVAVLGEAAAIEPASSVVAHFLARSQMGLLDYEGAIATLKPAVARHPGDAALRLDLAVAELTAGDPAAGWSWYESRPAIALPVPLLTVPRWRAGMAVAGRRIALIAEQGLGDAVHFARYAPLVVERGAIVSLLVPPSVKPLLDGVWPACRVCTDGETWPPFDLHCPLPSLPHVLGIAQPLGMAAPYVRAAADRRAHWRELVGGDGPPRVGLVWAGNPEHVRDRQRSIPLESMRASAPQGLRFVSLQHVIRESDRAALAAWPELLVLGGQTRDFADTAALMETLDAIVCVDTSVAHVAGALGLRVLLLLPHRPDWRWGLHSERTPWYPSMQLLRQDADGRWEPVLRRAIALLLQLAGTEARERAAGRDAGGGALSQKRS